MLHMQSLRWKITLNILVLLLIVLIIAYVYLHQSIIHATGLKWIPFAAGNPIPELERKLLYVIFFILVSMGLGVFILAKGIITPLEGLLPLTKRIAAGDLDQQIPIHTNDEVGVLSRHLNEMVETLRNSFREIADERNKMRAILASMTDSLLAVDQVGRVILINPAAEHMFGKKGSGVKNNYLLEVIRNHEADDLVKQVLAKGMPMEKEVRLFPTTNQLFKLNGSPIISEQGRIAGAVLAIRNITEIRRLEQVRKEFVANVSHELRTPLTSIRGFIETLLEGALEDPELSRRFLTILDSEAQRLQSLIEDLLALSNLENLSYKKDPGRAYIKPVMERIFATVAPLVHEKEIELTTEIADDFSALAVSENYLSQVLLNLIDNAVKYTPKGGKVFVRACKKNNTAFIEVEDTGIGIPADSIPRVFERFYRVDKARSRDMGGTGLGLAIVKHIVESHGGSVSVQSQPGQGSCFCFTLPFAAEKS